MYFGDLIVGLAVMPSLLTLVWYTVEIGQAGFRAAARTEIEGFFENTFSTFFNFLGEVLTAVRPGRGLYFVSPDAS